MTDQPALSIQERHLPDLRCFGCGPANPKGLQLRSFAADDDTVRASFRPWPEHDNGLGYLNGGIIATVLDCHGAAAMILRAAQLGLVRGGALPYVTAGLAVRYLRPSPLDDAVDLVARVKAADGDHLEVEVELWWQAKVRATGASSWKRWRPRPP